MKEYLDLIFKSDLNDVAVIDKGKEIKYSELLELHDKIKESLPRCPFYNGMAIDESGCFEINETFLQPDEALILGKFLVEFYGDNKDKEIR